MLEGLEKAKLEVLRRRASRVVADEPVHRKFAAGRIRELGASPAAAELARDLRGLLPEILCWFGPPGERGVDVLREAGLVELDNERLRQGFLDRVMPVLAEAGLEVGIVWSAEREAWEYGTLPWESWNNLERRLEPTPTGGTS
jgi:1,2-phenylacetyl-CoA epoxidase catalytic subunit